MTKLLKLKKKKKKLYEQIFSDPSPLISNTGLLPFKKKKHKKNVLLGHKNRAICVKALKS
jgi:hypothetical protein